MRTTVDGEADTAYVQLVPEVIPGHSVRNEIVETAAVTVLLDFDKAGLLPGVEVLAATKVLDRELLACVERIDRP
ncbi:DUF2283 domain-containing protein [Microbacterium esteraromaticum]|uniref:DUF2283 domain-containing protein n=1 Tax=Microbacterium esteraromaticum TaxID=57043 RepID=UPI0019D3EE9F|nr:DUF2283 domain-containing protein [Microbacterium esteraromaticum]MBN7794428.1 DUF2283 domain-containing protein [Microbacterium esteraromaticum]